MKDYGFKCPSCGETSDLWLESTAMVQTKKAKMVNGALQLNATKAKRKLVRIKADNLHCGKCETIFDMKTNAFEIEKKGGKAPSNKKKVDPIVGDPVDDLTITKEEVETFEEENYVDNDAGYGGATSDDLPF